MRVTSAATVHFCGLATVPGAARRMVHLLHFPRRACPFSGNPVLGVVRVAYSPAAITLEVVALRKYLSKIVKPAPNHPRTVEGVAARIASDAATVLGVPVTVDLLLLVRPWQILHVQS